MSMSIRRAHPQPQAQSLSRPQPQQLHRPHMAEEKLLNQMELELDVPDQHPDCQWLEDSQDVARRATRYDRAPGCAGDAAGSAFASASAAQSGLGSRPPSMPRLIPLKAATVAVPVPVSVVSPRRRQLNC